VKSLNIALKVVALLLTLFFCLPAQGQKKEAGRYKSLQSRGSYENVDELLREARQLSSDNPKEALNKVEEALGISLASKARLNEAKCYLLLGDINKSIDEWKLALDNYTSAYEKLGKTYQSTADYKMALRGLGETHLHLGNHAQALQYYQEGLAQKLTASEKAQFQVAISEVYYQMGDYDTALRVIEQVQIAKIADDALEFQLQNQKAKIFVRQNEVDKAMNSLESSQSTLRSNRGAIPQSQASGVNDAKEEVVEALHEQKRYDDEIDLRNRSIELSLESNDLPEVSKDKIGIGKALDAKGETGAAIRELEEAALIADTVGDPRDQAKAFLALAALYEKHGRTSQALTTYKRYSSAVQKTDAQNESRLTEKAELIKKQRDIEELKSDVAIGQHEETIAEATVFRQKLIIYGLLLIILIIAVTSRFIYKNAQASKTANQLLALKSLRSQMNPHFIFNALNSVNHFVAQNDERTANKFLSEFSRLMRLVLENSREDFIPLDKEQEIISLYLKLEHYRFRDKFEYEIKIDENINPEAVQIPPMLLQPYIENAVWHGLRYKESKGHLSVHMRKNTNGLEVEIADNGIGRKRSAELKTANQKKQSSTGLKNIQERLSIINKVYKSNYRVDIRDGQSDGVGTTVIITLPEHKRNGRS
jgi:tetratricopeptide (TPR) repeat protein